jgi:alpha-L-fucosidase
MMKRLYAILILVFIMGTIQSQPNSPVNDSSRMDWWKDAKFGMFIHWGVYAVPAGTYEGNKFLVLASGS